MAWQVLLLRLPDAMTTLASLPVDYVAPPIGETTRVADRITHIARRACVRVDHVTAEGKEPLGKQLVVMRNDDFVIEAELGGVAEVDRVLLRVLGSDAAVPLVCSLAQELGASAVDCETDMVLDADAVVPDTLRQWQTRIDGLR